MDSAAMAIFESIPSIQHSWIIISMSKVPHGPKVANLLITQHVMWMFRACENTILAVFRGFGVPGVCGIFGIIKISIMCELNRDGPKSNDSKDFDRFKIV